MFSELAYGMNNSFLQLQGWIQDFSRGGGWYIGLAESIYWRIETQLKTDHYNYYSQVPAQSVCLLS